MHGMVHAAAASGRPLRLSIETLVYHKKLEKGSMFFMLKLKVKDLKPAPDKG